MSSPPVTRAPYPEHPNRCQGNGPQGQCIMLALEGSKQCKMHGGGTILRAEKKREQHRYDIAKWRDKIARHTEDDAVKDLTAEIGVLRMLLEELLRSCENEVDLITNAPLIADMVLKIDKLVNSCHRLEDKMGNLLDKSAIIAFAASAVEIISTNISDATIVAKIADQLAQALSKDSHDC